MSVKAVIGDIHGCIRTLDRLINVVEKKYSDVTYISLGDIIDRGPGICDVMSLFMKMADAGKLSMVRGNHEDVLIDFADGTADYDYSNWLTYGGRETLACIMGSKNLPATAFSINPYDYEPYIGTYINFLKRADYKQSYVCSENRFMFSHAGIGPSRGLSHMINEFQMRENYLFMWSRDTWRSIEPYYGYTMVHGHTPVTEVDKHVDPHRPFVNRNDNGQLVSVAVDTGCVYGFSLSAMVIDELTGQFEFESVRNCE